jgi:hypothetical protein
MSHQTCLENEHKTMMWSMVYDSWSYRKQAVCLEPVPTWTFFYFSNKYIVYILVEQGHGKIQEQCDTSIPFYALPSSTSDSALVQACMCQQAMSIGKRKQLEPWFQFSAFV